MKKAVLFDLDGVIVDTALYHYKGWKMLADKLGVPFNEKANEKLRGVPRRESLLMLLGNRKMSEGELLKNMALKNDFYLEKVQSIRPKDALPGAAAMLRGLRKAGYKIGLGSSSKNAKLVLRLLKLTDAFDTIVDGTQIVKGKPDPELFVTGAKRLGVAPENCLVVEDAESGIEAAIAAGMHTLGIGDVKNLGNAERVVAGLHEIDVKGIDAIIEGQPAPGEITRHPSTMAKIDPTWLVTESGFRQKQQAWRESLFALGNGYMGIRGSVEEYDLPYPDSRPDTLVAGVFDKYESWYQTIVNLPFPFATRIRLNGESVSMLSGQVTHYKRQLDMYRGVLTRSFVWTDKKGRETRLCYERFVSMADRQLAAMRVSVTPVNWSGSVVLENFIDAEVDNIDFHKGGYQMRPERYYFVDLESAGGMGKNGIFSTVKTKTNPYRVSESIRMAMSCEGKKVTSTGKVSRQDKKVIRQDTLKVGKGKTYVMEKMIGVATNRDGHKGAALLKAADAVATSALERGFETVLADHCVAWLKRWRSGDVTVTGHQSDQQALRFSIFHLCQFVNPEDNKVNIGSRGLTAEMHYGNCFWDTELFILPYYIYTWPEAARALLEYRYQTLPEARNKAKRLFFEGAMYPWMSSYPGKEQADYWEYANIAIHIVGDVHYALSHYQKATADVDFMEKYGAEIIFETARFWNSRAFYNARRKAYVINTVKGPNEYDGVVNNNTYTNWQARHNLQEAVRLAKVLKKQKSALYKKLAKKIKLTDKELQAWEKTAKGLFINLDKKKNLYMEDDMFVDKEPFEMKKLKPGQKIITELGVSWDTLLRLQIVKQADVLLMMALFPDNFTDAQKKAAWDYYEPKTCHDSSLSPNTHAIMAAQLGMRDKAMHYWDETARLDIDDTMKNSFLGVHSACVGGTWLIVMQGFAGMRLRDNGFAFTPRLPKRWQKIQFRLVHQNRVLEVTMDKKAATFRLTAGATKPLQIEMGKKKITLKSGTEAVVRY